MQIGKMLADFDDQADAVEAEIKQLQRFKQGLMQDLLSGEVRTTDADIEIPDEVLAHG